MNEITIICPNCNHEGPESTFEPSLCDEYFCPACDKEFMIDWESGEYEEDGEEDPE